MQSVLQKLFQCGQPEMGKIQNHSSSYFFLNHKQNSLLILLTELVSTLIEYWQWNWQQLVFVWCAATHASLPQNCLHSHHMSYMQYAFENSLESRWLIKIINTCTIKMTKFAHWKMQAWVESHITCAHMHGVHSQNDCCMCSDNWDGTKPGLWTGLDCGLDWTVDWTRLW